MMGLFFSVYSHGKTYEINWEKIRTMLFFCTSWSSMGTHDVRVEKPEYILSSIERHNFSEDYLNIFEFFLFPAAKCRVGVLSSSKKLQSFQTFWEKPEGGNLVAGEIACIPKSVLDSSRVVCLNLFLILCWVWTSRCRAFRRKFQDSNDKIEVWIPVTISRYYTANAKKSQV